jgi:hypothetical protein
MKASLRWLYSWQYWISNVIYLHIHIVIIIIIIINQDQSTAGWRVPQPDSTTIGLTNLWYYTYFYPSYHHRLEPIHCWIMASLARIYSFLSYELLYLSKSVILYLSTYSYCHHHHHQPGSILCLIKTSIDWFYSFLSYEFLYLSKSVILYLSTYSYRHHHHHIDLNQYTA